MTGFDWNICELAGCWEIEAAGGSDVDGLQYDIYSTHTVTLTHPIARRIDGAAEIVAAPAIGIFGR